MDINLLKLFSERVRYEMSQNNLGTIKDLSKATGIPRTTINSWLNQTRSPQIESLVVLAKFFDVTTDYLLGLQEI